MTFSRFRPFGPFASRREELLTRRACLAGIIDSAGMPLNDRAVALAEMHRERRVRSIKRFAAQCVIAVALVQLGFMFGITAAESLAASIIAVLITVAAAVAGHYLLTRH